MTTRKKSSSTRKPRSKTRRYSINYSFIYGYKRKRKRRTIDIALRKQAENIFKDIERCKDGEEYFNKVKKKYLL